MNDTTGGTTKAAKVKRLRRDHNRLSRQRGIKYKELTGLARRLGRKRRKGRGGDQAWESEPFPDLRATTIPEHPGDMNPFIAKGILNALEEDLERLEEGLGSGEDQEGDGENTHDL